MDAAAGALYESAVLFPEHDDGAVEFAAELAGDYADYARVPARVENDDARVGAVGVFLRLFHCVFEDSALDVLALLVYVVEFASGAVAGCEVVAEHHFEGQGGVRHAAACVNARAELERYVDWRDFLAEGYAACLYQSLYPRSARGF